MRYKFLFIVVYLLQLIVPEVFSATGLTCPNPSVKKRTIIQSSDSIANGAVLIGKNVVSSARQCYKLCCDNLSCNVAVMHYKEKTNVMGETITEKYCFLFNCGFPSLCTYEYHHRYAIIDLGLRKDGREKVNDEKKVLAVLSTVPPTKPPTKPPTTTTTTTTTTELKSTSPKVDVTNAPEVRLTVINKDTTPVKTPVKTPSIKVITSKESTKSEPTDACKKVCPYNYDPVCGDDNKTYDNKCLFELAQCKNPSLKLHSDEVCRECPPTVPMAMCSDDPCTISSCPAHRDATCKANFCGGCNAVYYDQHGGKVNCSSSGVTVSRAHNEQSVTVSAEDYEETPDESLPRAKVEDNDPYYREEKRKWLGSKTNETGSPPKVPIVVVVKENNPNTLMSLPLLIALIICIVLLIGVIYRVKCAVRGKAKKLPVDDGDYLINGMYL